MRMKNTLRGLEIVIICIHFLRFQNSFTYVFENVSENIRQIASEKFFVRRFWAILNDRIDQIQQRKLLVCRDLDKRN